jgi:hypothetical protein
MNEHFVSPDVLKFIFSSPFPIAVSGEAARPLFCSEICTQQHEIILLNSRPHGRVIVKFNLPSADPAHGAPAMFRGKFLQLVPVERPQDPQLRRMRNENLRLYRQRRGNFCRDWRKVFIVHVGRVSFSISADQTLCAIGERSFLG